MDPNDQQVELRIDVVVENKKQTQQTQKLFLPFLERFHAGYFRISLSICGQALLWKTLKQPIENDHSFRRIFRLLPNTAFLSLWSLALFTLASLSLIYILRCFLKFKLVKAEFLHNVGVNYLFVPWISWLLLLQSSPFISPNSLSYKILWWVFVIPIVMLDLKIYGQWLTKGKRFLSTAANPTSQMSVIGNLVGARAAAIMGWKESAICLFSLGMIHYLVLFVTLYQRLQGCNSLPARLRPVFFLFFAAPSMASLAWESIVEKFDISSKMLFFISIFLFVSLALRPSLFRKSMRKFTVAWWAYSFPLSALALASNEYAKEVKATSAHIYALLLTFLSVLVSLLLIIITIFNSNSMIPAARSDHHVLISSGSSSSAEA